jgi:hypothetical protein
MDFKGYKAFCTICLNRLFEECNRAIMLEMEKMLVSCTAACMSAAKRCIHAYCFTFQSRFRRKKVPPPETSDI